MQRRESSPRVRVVENALHRVWQARRSTESVSPWSPFGSAALAFTTNAQLLPEGGHP